jgi:hypothetical protein
MRSQFKMSVMAPLALSVLAGIALSSAMCSSMAQAAALIDQSTMNSPGFYSGTPVMTVGATSYQGGQTFTAGLSGVLAQIDVMVGGNIAYPMNLRLRPVTGGVIDANDSNIIASFSFTAPDWNTTGPLIYPGPTSVNVSSAGLSVTAGSQYAFTLDSAADPAGLGGWAHYSGSYQGGQGYYRNSAASIFASAGADHAFATFVETSSAVPEPSTWAMMLLGFGAIGFAMRRRKEPKALARLRPACRSQQSV